MCAINGYTAEDRDRVERMNAATMHRGPDGTGVLVRDGVTLGHNRLSIIDLSSRAGQPMCTPDDRYAIVFNGEIYNFKELRAELASYPFGTESDTEVILAAVMRWGSGAFERFDGIFALAIHDKEKRAVTLARDRAGVKPLYYCIEGASLIFSSELKGLIAAGCDRKIDATSLDLYLRLGYVPGPGSAIEGIRKLPPGSYATWEDGMFSIESFVQSPPSAERMSLRKASILVEEAVDESVRRQLVSDRPLGIYLSGGIDSSVVLDAAARLRPGIDTFSVGFTLADGEEPAKFNADFELASRTARTYGTNHHGFMIEPEEVLPALEQATYHMDEPLSNPTAVPMLILAERTKQSGIDVVLGGDGGDEIFGGYERYLWSMRSDAFRKIPGAMRNLLIRRFPELLKLNEAPGIERYARFHFLKETEICKLMGEEYRDGSKAKEEFFAQFMAEGIGPLEQFMRADQHAWLVDESLHKSDRLSMAYGIEARVPLLGAPVIDAANRIASFHKTSVFNTKIVLKQAFKNRIPSYLLHQPKRGWQSPAAKWLRYPHISSYARAVMSPGYHASTDGMFDWETIGHMLEKHIDGTQYGLTALWRVLAFRLWARTYDVRI